MYYDELTALKKAFEFLSQNFYNYVSIFEKTHNVSIDTKFSGASVMLIIHKDKKIYAG
jgi:hypothetical protein